MDNKAKLPEFLRGYFWDVDFAKIDTEKYEYFIVKRVLHYGNDKAIIWLFKNYNLSLVKKVIMTTRDISPEKATLWGKVFNIPKSKIMRFKKGFPNPPGRLWGYWSY